VTWLPAPGTRVRRGQPLLRVDDEPVVLLYGALPMYRPLAAGVKGADVKQLESNLAALGYRGFTVDEEFSATTAAAVKQWQKNLKRPETGTVERGHVVYAPGEVRIAQQLVRPGASAAGDVLTYTGNIRVVTVTATAGETAWAVKDAKVTVTLPGGATLTGAVTGVSAGAPAEGGPPAAGQAAPAGQDADGATMVTIGIADQAALGELDAAPVEVRYVAKERKDVLTVPVGALLALAEGGYGVEVVAGGTTRIVTVTPGLFADGRVEISGAGLEPGTVVGVPA
jgi:peptidoglycan hydrolase-like protein with peptidoglycan-binding domain